MQEKLFIITFGCQMNEADSEYMAMLFRKRGFTLTDDIKQANAIIVNTCTVRQLAEDKAISQIGRLKYWKANHPEGKIFITGCAAQRLGAKKLKHKFPFIYEVLGAKNILSFDKLLDKYYPKITSDIRYQNIYRSPLTAYVTIMRGCSHHCSYCIVPSVRGNASFISPSEIIADTKEKIAAGAKEIVLLGQTVNSYKFEKFTFTNLLSEILNIQGLSRLRFMSPHPIYFDKDFKKLLAQNTKLARHIHLPVQSGSDRILKLMRRGYTHQKYLDLLTELRSITPELAISTDFIVSYPSETETDFAETIRLVNEASFSAAFCFKYSPRTDKPEMAADIPEKITEKRLEQLLKTVKKNSHLALSQRIAKIEEVLFETPNFGRSSANMAVRIAQEVQPGSIHKVLIEAAEHNTLHGKVIYD